MAATVFDVESCTVECQRCGAPIAAARQGGEVSCRYCGAINSVVSRARDARQGSAPSVGDEIARLSRLKGQLEHPLEGHAYDLRRPPASGIVPTDRLRVAWGEAKARAAAATSIEAQRSLLWIAFALADAQRRDRKALEARAVLETAMGMLGDPGHRHLVRCKLAEEALVEGDAAAAEGWLRECDPAPELIDLDGPYRAAAAGVMSAKGDFEGVLSLVGRKEGDVPLLAEHRARLAALRVHAWELLEQPDRAWSAFVEARDALGNALVRTALDARRLAPLTRRRDELEELAALSRDRDAVTTGIRTAAAPLAMVPLLALVAMGCVSASRCSCDADPLAGAPSYVLCPAKCAGCDGPWRVHTEWIHNAPGESSTDGPRYWCPTRSNRVASMTDQELENESYKLGAYELSWQPFASSYFVLEGLFLPLVVPATIRRHSAGRRRRDDLSARVAAEAARLRVPVPEAMALPSYRGLVIALALVAVTIALSGGSVLVWLAVR